MKPRQKKSDPPQSLGPIIGQNTASGQMLLGYVERVERLKVDAKAVTADIAIVLAEAKGAGFSAAMIRTVVKRRAAKPHDVADADAMLEMYEHAIGQRTDTPLERLIAQATADTASRDSVIEAMKRFVPVNGSITVESDGKPFKLVRGDDGEVTVHEVIDQPSPTATTRPMPAPREPVPDVDDAGAEQLGREAFKANQPIVKNPFPFDDSRRWSFDKGWRAESGTDGFGKD